MASFSDNFDRADNDSLGANWTEYGGDIDIASNKIAFMAGSFTTMLARYNTPADSADQYVKWSMDGDIGTYMGCVLRMSTDAAAYYTVTYTGGTNFGWYSYSSSGTGETNEGADTALTGFSTPASLGVTIKGTGAATTVRVWLNPTANSPETDLTTWDSSAADITWNVNPSRAGSGNYVGLGGAQSTGGATYTMDDFYGGDTGGGGGGGAFTVTGPFRTGF